MTAAAEISDFEFFAPASTDMVDGLVAQYKITREKIEKASQVMTGELSGTIGYFIDGNKDSRDQWYHLERLFNVPGAIASLNAEYWQRALKLTDVIDCMPQKRRDEWFDQIREKKTPDFEEETVRNTLMDLLQMRSQFFAERVDGIFRALSGTHVTNRPEGFGKRMILNSVLDGIGLINSSKTGYIGDLRCVIAKFMGRDEPSYGATDAVIRACQRNPGQWMTLDGGALKIRVYAGVGTAHLEVHPDMAWRLNAVLASLYPTAIPPKHRQRPKRKIKEFDLMQRPLPFEVITILARLEPAQERVDSIRNHYKRIPNTRYISESYRDNKVALKEAERVLESIGGEPDRINGYHFWRFDYDPQAVLDWIVCSGCIPDDKSHQFYPTPESLARRVIELAEIDEAHTVLEPSAGTGALADLVPSCQHMTCIEVSRLRADVLKAKGHYVVQGDFLKHPGRGSFDRIVMNPPFSEGRWQAHLEAAADQTAPGGRVVAILPMSARGKDLLPGWSCAWHGPFENEFAGTSIAVVILVADKGIRS